MRRQSRPIAPSQSMAPRQGAAPVSGPAPSEQAASWGDLLEENDTSVVANGTMPRASRRGPASMTQRVGGLPPTAPTRTLGWVVGIASAIVVGFVIVAGVLTWIFGGGTKGKAPTTFRAGRFLCQSPRWSELLPFYHRGSQSLARQEQASRTDHRSGRYCRERCFGGCSQRLD